MLRVNDTLKPLNDCELERHPHFIQLSNGKIFMHDISNPFLISSRVSSISINFNGRSFIIILWIFISIFSILNMIWCDNIKLATNFSVYLISLIPFVFPYFHCSVYTPTVRKSIQSCPYVVCTLWKEIVNLPFCTEASLSI